MTFENPPDPRNLGLSEAFHWDVINYLQSFPVPSLSLYKTWPHLRPGFILYLFLRRPSLRAFESSPLCLCLLGRPCVASQACPPGGLAPHLQPLSAAWRLLYSQCKQITQVPSQSPGELPSVAALFTSTLYHEQGTTAIKGLPKM